MHLSPILPKNASLALIKLFQWRNYYGLRPGEPETYQPQRPEGVPPDIANYSWKLWKTKIGKNGGENS